MTDNVVRKGYFRAHAKGDTLNIDRHSSGFFSDCSVRLHNIIAFFNLNKKLPRIVNSDGMFNRYRDTQIGDISGEFFETSADDIEWINKVKYSHTFQYNLYDKLNISQLKPFLSKYFEPTNNIKQISRDIISQYNLCNITNNFENACTILHRGTDKSKETTIPEAREIKRQVDKILKINSNIMLIFQSDCAEFLDIMKRAYKDNYICFNDYIRTVGNSATDKTWRSVDLQTSSTDHNNIYIKNFLAIIRVLSRSKYIICETGNCGMWLLFYRRYIDNIIQYQGRWNRESIGWYDNL